MSSFDNWFPVGSNHGTSCLFNLYTTIQWKITLEAKQNSPPRQGKNKYTNKSSTYFADGKNHSQKKHERERHTQRERERSVHVHIYLWRKVSLFVLFVKNVEISQTMPTSCGALWYIGKPLMSRDGCTKLVSSHFERMVKLLNIEQNFHEKLI